MGDDRGAKRVTTAVIYKVSNREKEEKHQQEFKKILAEQGQEAAAAFMFSDLNPHDFEVLGRNMKVSSIIVLTAEYLGLASPTELRLFKHQAALITNTLSEDEAITEKLVQILENEKFETLRSTVLDLMIEIGDISVNLKEPLTKYLKEKDVK